MSDSHHAAALAVIKAILTVADAEGMPDDMVIPIWPKADPQDPAPFTDHPPLTVGGVRALADVAAQLDALAAFKAFVHRRLDEAGVPPHPDGPHSKEGCRIGDRLDIVLNERQPLPVAQVKEIEWKPAYCPNGSWFGYAAKTVFGTFQVGSEDGAWAMLEDSIDPWEWEPKFDCRHGDYHDLMIPRQACEAEYRRRALSVINTVSAEQVRADERKAVREWLDDKPGHSDDLAVDRFAQRMKAKLAQAREDGRGGWDSPACSVERLAKLCVNHVHKGDPVDVANFCMMLSERGVAGNGTVLTRNIQDREQAMVNFVESRTHGDAS